MTYSRRAVLGQAAAGLASAALPTSSLAATGGVLKVACAYAPRHLNPAISSSFAIGMPGTQIFASPLKIDANWNPRPYLAQSWQVAEDGLSVTLNLVPGATFHDGMPITSRDVAFSITLVRNQHPLPDLFAPVTRIDTPNDLTAVIHLSRPHPAILMALSSMFCPILPAHIYDDGQDILSHPANMTPIGSGPFRFTGRTEEPRLSLSRYEGFFLPGRPYLDGIEFLYADRPDTLFALIDDEAVDLVPFLSRVLDLHAVNDREDLQVTSDGYAALGLVNGLAFNVTRPPFDDLRIRQAIAYAIDTDFITRAIHAGYSQPLQGPMHPQHPFHTGAPSSYGLNIEAARALLDEAGVTPRSDGMRLKLHLDFRPGDGDHHRHVAEYIAYQLQQIGLEITLRPAPDVESWSARIARGDFEMTLDIRFTWPDPMFGLHVAYHSEAIIPGESGANFLGYANQNVDAALNAAAIEGDPSQRAQQYAQFQAEVARDIPTYGLATVPFQTAFRTRLSEPPRSVWGPLQSMDDLKITQG